MAKMASQLANQNGEMLRTLTGQGTPGLWTLLGGMGPEPGADTLRAWGGAGQVSGTSRIARANGDVRISGVASGIGVTTPTPVPPSGEGRDSRVL